jgi:hypothetical protein
MLETATATSIQTLAPRRRLEPTNDEKRQSARLSARPAVRVSALGTSHPIPCRAENVSEGGLFVVLPDDAVLRVGERCEVTFTTEAGGATGKAIPSLSGLTCYATVVRTSNRPGERPLHGGAGLRFDHPLFL